MCGMVVMTALLGNLFVSQVIYFYSAGKLVLMLKKIINYDMTPIQFLLQISFSVII